MKKLILTLIIILTGTFCVQAQEHLKFMGIPLTGNINSFQTKLKAKGFEVDKQICPCRYPYLQRSVRRRKCANFRVLQ